MDRSGFDIIYLFAARFQTTPLPPLLLVQRRRTSILAMFPHFLETWSFYHYSGPNQSFDSSAPLNLWPYPCIVSTFSHFLHTDCDYRVFSSASSQECNTELQAQDPITGLYYLYCSNECAAPKTLRDLPTVPILTGGFKRVARVNANTNTRAIPAFAKCNVSVLGPSVDVKPSNGLRSQALQQKTEVQRRCSHAFILRWDMCKRCNGKG